MTGTCDLHGSSLDVDALSAARRLAFNQLPPDLRDIIQEHWGDDDALDKKLAEALENVSPFGKRIQYRLSIRRILELA